MFLFDIEIVKDFFNKIARVAHSAARLISRGALDLKKDTKYHYNLEYKVKIKKNMVNLKYKQHALIKI